MLVFSTILRLQLMIIELLLSSVILEKLQVQFLLSYLRQVQIYKLLENSIFSHLLLYFHFFCGPPHAHAV